MSKLPTPTEIDLPTTLEECHALIRKLEKTATVDVLTGLLSQGAGMAALQEAREWREREAGEFHVLMIDVDDFKAVNDTPEWGGHANGDRVLAQIGHIIKDSTRKYDRAIRIGGDEFMVITTACEGGAHVIAENLLLAISERVKADPFGQVVQTVTIGVGSTKATADKALYEAKEAGKGCVSVAKAL